MRRAAMEGKMKMAVKGHTPPRYHLKGRMMALESTLMVVHSWESGRECASIMREVGAAAADQSWVKEKR